VTGACEGKQRRIRIIPPAGRAKFNRVLPALLALLGVLHGGCAAEERRPPVAPSVNLSRPAALIPADVDLVLRLDVRRFRNAMGAEWRQTLANVWHGFLLDVSGGTPDQAWVGPALNDTEALWLGCRMGARGCQDYVIVMRGHFSQPLGKYGYGASKNQRELGAGWVSYDTAHSERNGIARVYSRPPELMVLVSPAELDSAERSIEAGLDATELRPEETGLVSLLVRSHAMANVLRDRSRKAAQWLDSSERVEIRMEPQVAETQLTFAVTFSDAARAERAAQALKLLTEALTRFERRIRATDIDVQQLDAQVVLRVQLGANH
jgi:hypothetical protein